MSELSVIEEQQLAAYAKECLAEAQQSLKRSAELIDLANRTLMEMGAAGWNLADAWSKVGAVQAAVDKHIEAYLQKSGYRTPAERAYRRALMDLVPAPAAAAEDDRLRCMCDGRPAPTLSVRGATCSMCGGYKAEPVDRPVAPALQLYPRPS